MDASNYFDALDKLVREIGFEDERDRVLVYAECNKNKMFSIQQLGDLEGQRQAATAECVPLALITAMQATKSGERKKIIRIIHIPPWCPEVERLRNRVAQAVFATSPHVTECIHVDYRVDQIWEALNPWKGPNSMTPPKKRLQKEMDAQVAAGQLIKLPDGRYIRYPFEQLFLVFFAEDNGLVLRQFLTLKAAKEECAELSEAGFVTCITPVSVEQTFWWNGKKKSEYQVGEIRGQLALAHKLADAGVPLDTAGNRKGIPTLRRGGTKPRRE